MKYMEIRKEERKDWTRAGQNRGTSQDLKAVSEALSYLRQKGLSTVEDLEAFLESSGKSAADYRNQMKPKEARSKVIDGILASRTDCKECKPVYEKYQKIFFKKTKEKFKQEHPEVARYAKATAYLAKHPDDKDSTQKELQEEQETLLEEIAALKIPLTEVQEDLKKLRDIRYWVRKATPGTEESKEPPKKQPIKEALQDKADEKKAQSHLPVVRRLLSLPAHTGRRQNQSHPHPHRSRSSGNADPASCLGFYRYGTGNKPSRSGLHGFHNAPQPVLL